MLLQLEIPLPAVISAARSAQKRTVILDPAPVPEDLPPELYPLVDIITPNEVEASQLTGLAVDSLQTAAAAAEVLLERGAKQAIVTLGGGGVFCATGKESFAIPAGCISLSQGYIYNTCDLARFDISAPCSCPRGLGTQETSQEGCHAALASDNWALHILGMMPLFAHN